ncbi:MAG: PDDEXK nuclease domain-containing protein [Elusimicrobia bacterium]|nr:PDDEXK nuclease domain-containing protein [Elusimicrobiota bacterium]
MKKIILSTYGRLLSEVKTRIHSAQYEALRAVNKELIALYWDIGKVIAKRQKGQTWGKSVVEKLSNDLHKEFPGMQGFSTQNLWYMRQFYREYSSNSKLQPLVGEIGWAHNIVIMSKCKADIEREFYIRATKKFGWTKNILALNIDNETYAKYLLNQTNFNKTLPIALRNQAKLAVKDNYTFDFLELGEEHRERELEQAITAKIGSFLREMGGIFAFVGNQYPICVNGKDFFIDLLLYHRKLRCLVAVELKAGEFQPEHIGKMQFYLAALDAKEKTAQENSSIGIILCRNKHRTIVEYALKNSNKPIGVATYRIVSTLPKELKGMLPSPAQATKLLEAMA